MNGTNFDGFIYFWMQQKKHCSNFCISFIVQSAGPYNTPGLHDNCGMSLLQGKLVRFAELFLK